MSDADILTRRLSREGCVLAGTQLGTHLDELRKDKHRLVPPVAEASQEALDATKALEALDGSAEASMTDIDRGADRCIAGLDSHLAAVAQCLDHADVLPLTPAQQARVEDAASLRVALFPAGTAFLRLPYRQQWERMSALVRATEQPDNVRLLRQLGLTAEAERVKAWTDVYGARLGLTETQAPDALVQALQRWHDAVGSLVVLVRAHYRDRNDATHQRVRDLLLSPYDRQVADERAVEARAARKRKPEPVA